VGGLKPVNIGNSGYTGFSHGFIKWVYHGNLWLCIFVIIKAVFCIKSKYNCECL